MAREEVLLSKRDISHSIDLDLVLLMRSGGREDSLKIHFFAALLNLEINLALIYAPVPKVSEILFWLFTN